MRDGPRRRRHRQARVSLPSVPSADSAPAQEIRTVPLADRAALRAAVDLLVVIATEVERDAVLRRLRPLGRRRAILRGSAGPSTYYFGSLGSYGAVVTMCRMGSVGDGAAKDTVA